MNILAVGAHPDDVEWGCGAALAAHVEAGSRVGVLVLTDGHGNGNTATRRRESEAAASVLGVELMWGGMRDGEVRHTADAVAVVEESLRLVGAERVYVHWPYDSHQDHVAASGIVTSAARHAGDILYYQSPSSIGFLASVFLDAKEYLDVKEKALACHSSQVRGSLMVEVEDVETVARYWGAFSRVPGRLAEGFMPARMRLEP